MPLLNTTESGQSLKQDSTGHFGGEETEELEE